jgi:hypothetical protein
MLQQRQQLRRPPLLRPAKSKAKSRKKQVLITVSSVYFYRQILLAFYSRFNPQPNIQLCIIVSDSSPSCPIELYTISTFRSPRRCRNGHVNFTFVLEYLDEIIDLLTATTLSVLTESLPPPRTSNEVSLSRTPENTRQPHQINYTTEEFTGMVSLSYPSRLWRVTSIRPVEYIIKF